MPTVALGAKFVQLAAVGGMPTVARPFLNPGANVVQLRSVAT